MDQAITSLSAIELAQRIKEHRVKVVEAVSAYLEQIERCNGSVNAISKLRPKEEILAEADQKDRMLENGHVAEPLFGVPITIKESIMVAGLPNTNGDPLLRNNIATEDALIVKKLKDAGAIILGVTNIALFSIDWQSVTPWNGTTNNPHDLTRTAGGSSGGAAAAVAASMSPISIGSDAGGSIRVPAHFCGVYGLRPTENYVSNRGHLNAPGRPTARRHVVTPGPLANSLEDLKVTMKALTSQRKHATSEIPDVPFEQSSWRKGTLRIAYAESLNDVEIDHEYLGLFRKFIKTIAAHGHACAVDRPNYDERESYYIYNKLMGFENGVNTPNIPLLNWLLYLFIGLKYKDHSWALGMAKGIRMNNVQYARVIDYKDQFADTFQSFLSDYDIWITPSSASEAFKHQRAGKPFTINGKKVPYTKAIATYNFTTAFAGHPILVMPIGKLKNGMPVGVQIHSKKWTENRLLQIAANLEAIWHKE